MVSCWPWAYLPSDLAYLAVSCIHSYTRSAESRFSCALEGWGILLSVDTLWVNLFWHPAKSTWVVVTFVLRHRCTGLTNIRRVGECPVSHWLVPLLSTEITAILRQSHHSILLLPLSTPCLQQHEYPSSEATYDRTTDARTVMSSSTTIPEAAEAKSPTSKIGEASTRAPDATKASRQRFKPQLSCTLCRTRK